MNDRWTCPHCGTQLPVKSIRDQHIREEHPKESAK